MTTPWYSPKEYRRGLAPYIGALLIGVDLYGTGGGAHYEEQLVWMYGYDDPFRDEQYVG